MNLQKRKSNNPEGRPLRYGEKTSGMRVIIPNSKLNEFKELMKKLRETWEQELNPG